MAEVKLYGMPPSAFTRTARLICHEKGVVYDLVATRPGPEAVEAGHPFGRIPVLRHEGQTVYETRAIARYVEMTFDGPELIPSRGREAVLSETFVSVVCDYLARDLMFGVLLPRLGFRQSPESEIAASVEKVKSDFAVLDRHLADHEYLAGGRLSVADLLLVPQLFYVPKIADLHEATGRYSHLVRWAKLMGQRASIKATDPDLATQAGKAA